MSGFCGCHFHFPLIVRRLVNRLGLGQNNYTFPSLRLWLQSASLLAVLAGYTLLLVLNQGVSSFQRLKAHHDLVLHLLDATPVQLSHTKVLPGLIIQSVPRWERQEPTLLALDRELWLVSTTPFPQRLHRNLSLRVEQNVTALVQGERLSQLLLVAAAGASALLTSALLRLVLRRGLVQPLEELAQKLDAMEAPPVPLRLLEEGQQPQELRPIAIAFNGMQLRLAANWEQQRSFVDGVAHELRTPLTLISGHAQSLQRHVVLAPMPDAAASVQLIASEAHRMGLLVSDLLDLARRDAGRFELQLSPINPEDVLLECLERLVASSQGRLQIQACEPPCDLPLALADPDRLQQCLAALIDNALRYSPAPLPVQLLAEIVDDQLLLRVRDQGPGVPDQERDQIFDRFVRGSASIGTRGSGLGLSIVRLLIEAMGGSVQVIPAPGGGADFQLLLPRACV